MSHNKSLSINIENYDNDLYTVIDFLNNKFGATCYSHQYPKNIVTLEGRRWWVVTSAEELEFDLCIGGACSKSTVIETLKKLDAGLLVFRKAEKKYLFAVYLIENIESLGKNSADTLTVNWTELYSQNLIYEKGIVIDNEIIGFKKLRRARQDFGSESLM